MRLRERTDDSVLLQGIVEADETSCVEMHGIRKRNGNRENVAEKLIEHQ